MERLRKAIHEKNIKDLDEIIFEIDILLLEKGYFTDSLFKEILSILKEREFLELPKSWYLLKLFEENNNLLSEEQKCDLIKVLEIIFEHFFDTTSCFLSVEIIVESFVDNRSLLVLKNLKKVKAELARSVVPHGFQWFVKKCHDPVLAKRALNELFEMRYDSSKIVQEEAKKEFVIAKLA